MSDNLADRIVADVLPPGPCHVCGQTMSRHDPWGMVLLADRRRYGRICLECSNALRGFLERRHAKARDRAGWRQWEPPD